ncbi:MAG: hypothetical protein ACFFD4_28925 [Candidatus Odinarchaeota archaeon]
MSECNTHTDTFNLELPIMSLAFNRVHDHKPDNSKFSTKMGYTNRKVLLKAVFTIKGN